MIRETPAQSGNDLRVVRRLRDGRADFEFGECVGPTRGGALRKRLIA
jgi:hypothetical protein